MNLHKLADDFLKVSRDVEDPDIARRLLLKINKSPRHYLAVGEMTDEEQEVAQTLFEKKWIDYIPADKGVSIEVLMRDRSGEATIMGPKEYRPTTRKIPARYVLTTRGAHHLNSFPNTLDQDIEEYQIEKENKRKEERKRVDPESVRHRIAPNSVRPRIELEPEIGEEEDDDQVQINRTLNFSL